MNKITIKEHKLETVLYNFKKLDRILINGVCYIRVLCDSRYYYFRASLTSIIEIEMGE